MSYTATVVNAGDGAITCDGRPVASGATTMLTFSALGNTIIVPGRGLVHVNDGPSGTVRIGSGDETVSIASTTLTLTVRRDAEMLVEPGAGDQAASELTLGDDPRDHAAVGTPAADDRLLSVTSAAHTFRTGDFTVSMLFRFVPGLRGTAADTALLRRRDANGCGFELAVSGYLIVDYIRLIFTLDDGNASTVYAAPNVPQLYDGNWHSVAVVRSGSTVSASIDAQPQTLTLLDGTPANTDLATLAPLFVGSYTQSMQDHSVDTLDNTGLVEDVSLWNRALSATEIVATMTNQLEGDEPGLVGFYRFDQSLADASPTAALLTCSGAPPDFPAIIHGFTVTGANDHVMVAMGALGVHNAATAQLLASDPPLVRQQTLTVTDGTPFLYGAIVSADGSADMPDGVTLQISSPSGPVTTPQNTDTAWVEFAGGAIQAFCFVAPQVGAWTFTVTAPATAGFQLHVQTLPSADVPRTILTTVQAAYPNFRPPTSTALGAEDWEWWEIAAAIVGVAALAAVVVIAAPIVAAAAATVTPATMLVAAATVRVVGVIGVAAGSFILSMHTTPEALVPEGTIKCANYLRWDPRPSVTVNVWSFVSFRVGMGHASLALSDGTYMSWWPVGCANVWFMQFLPPDFMGPASQTRTYSDDITAEGDQKTTPPTMFRDPDFRIKVFGLDEAAMTTWWAGCKADGQYRLPDKNCSTIVYEALVAGGALDKLTAAERAEWSSMAIWHPNLITRFATLLNMRTDPNNLRPTGVTALV